MSNESYITILNEKITYTDELKYIDELKFYVRNPRVYSKIVEVRGLPEDSDEKQKVIAERMADEKSVKKLIKTIKHQGGVSEPILVDIRTNEVIEGNSRLAALRNLYEKYDDEKWLTVPCRTVLLNDRQIDAYLHQTHIEGKTEWTAYEKSYFTYDRVVNGEQSPDEHSKITSISKSEISKRISTIKLMQENKDRNRDHFSYYDALIRNRTISQACGESNDLKKFFLREIKKENTCFGTALSMRDSMPEIINKPKVLNKLIKDKMSFEDARDQSKVSEPKQRLAKALSNLKEIKKIDIDKLEKSERNALKAEVRRCEQAIKRIQDILG